MTVKKIEFLQKSNLQNKNKYIDDWVKGTTSGIENDRELKRTTIYLPEELHKKLKLTAVNQNTSMTEIIIKALQSHML